MKLKSADLLSTAQQLREFVLSFLQSPGFAALPQSERFRRYYGPFVDVTKAARYTRSLVNLLEAGGVFPAGKRFFDAGCGFGVSDAVLALLGASTVAGLEVYPDTVAVACAWAAHCKLALDFRLGRVEQSYLPTSSYDVVLCVEAISHFRYPSEFLKETWRVLRPGGVLVVADDNNGDNMRVRRHLSAVWKRFEEGPAGTIGDHTVRIPYRQRRADLIMTYFPEFSPEQVKVLAEGTSGMASDQILEACRNYAATGNPPQSFYREGQCPIEPLTNQYIENSLRPADLRRELIDLRFDASVRPHFGGETRGGAVKAANRIMSSVSYLRYLSPGYRVYARKAEAA